VAIDLIGFGIVLPILPRYARDLSISPTVIGLIVGSFSLAQMVCAPIMGRLSDRFGRKPVLIFSLCGTAFGSLLTGLAGPVWLLFLGRVVDGASGASVSVAQAAVADVADPADRPRLLGLLGAAFGIGFVLGPAIGSLAALGGPHIPFFVAAAIAATNAVVAIRRLPETHRTVGHVGTAAETGERSRVAGAVPAHEVNGAPMERSPAGTGLVGDTETIDRATSAVPGSGIALIPLRARWLIGLAFVTLFAFSGFESTFSELIEDRFRASIASTGAVFTVIGLALVLVQGGLIHPAQAKLGASGTLRFGLGCNVVGLVLLAIDGGWLSVVPALAFLVLGQGLVSPTLSSAVAGQVAPEERGRLLGFQQSAGSLSRFLGPFAAGALYEHAGIPAPYLVGAGCVAVALLFVPGLPRDISREAVPPPAM